MGLFKTWEEWLNVRESNARKRAVKAAMNGSGPDLPGSYATCPSTNPRAMKIASKKGVVTKFPLKEEEKVPDYSFDRWLQRAEEFGDDINKIRKDTDSEERKLELKRKETDKSSTKPDTKEDDSSDEKEKDKDKLWKRLRDIHQKSLNGQKDKKDPSEEES
jgi:hypothetical protein